MIEIIQPDTPAVFEQYYALRYKILRQPWGQPPGSEKDDRENESIHLFALVDGEPAGVCRLQFNSPQEAQVRFMGVDEPFRRHKIGKLLMDEAEKIAYTQGRKHMTLQAREVAVNFYLSCGYTQVEKTFYSGAPFSITVWTKIFDRRPAVVGYQLCLEPDHLNSLQTSYESGTFLWPDFFNRELNCKLLSLISFSA